jgi:hypothetical protein
LLVWKKFLLQSLLDDRNYHFRLAIGASVEAVLQHITKGDKVIVFKKKKKEIKRETVTDSILLKLKKVLLVLGAKKQLLKQKVEATTEELKL